MAESVVSRRRFCLSSLVVIAVLTVLGLTMYNTNTYQSPRHLQRNVPGFINAHKQHAPNHTEVFPCPSDITAPRDKPVCTFPMLKQIFLDTAYFPTCIGWNKKEQLVPGQCRFPPRQDKTLGQCLVRKKVRRLVMLGDSNISRMYAAFINATGNCKQTKVEKITRKKGMQPDVSYFSKDRRGHFTHQRHCNSCKSEKNTCTIGGKDVIVEYVSMEFLWDIEITTIRVQIDPHINYCKVLGLPFDRPCPEARSTQQFIFKQYFQQTGYPDVILHFLSNHDKNMMTAGESLSAAELMGRMYELYVPKTSQIIIFSKWHEDIALKPPDWQKVKYENKYNSVEQVIRHNKAVSNGFRRAVMENSNIDVFFDMNTYGSGLAEKWGLDGVHKQPIYYDKVVRYFSSLFCS